MGVRLRFDVGCLTQETKSCFRFVTCGVFVAFVKLRLCLLLLSLTLPDPWCCVVALVRLLLFHVLFLLWFVLHVFSCVAPHQLAAALKNFVCLVRKVIRNGWDPDTALDGDWAENCHSRRLTQQILATRNNSKFLPRKCNLPPGAKHRHILIDCTR